MALPVVDKPPQYPSSSKKHHDWSSALQDEDEKLEGEAALNDMFQKIYKDADDATRKAMIKSYTESKGTTLSTNWSEVCYYLWKFVRSNCWVDWSGDCACSTAWWNGRAQVNFVEDGEWERED